MFCHTMQIMHGMYTGKGIKSLGFFFLFFRKWQLHMTTLYGYITDDKARQTFPQFPPFSWGKMFADHCALGHFHDAKLTPTQGCDLQGN